MTYKHSRKHRGRSSHSPPGPPPLPMSTLPTYAFCIERLAKILLRLSLKLFRKLVNTVEFSAF